MHLRGVQRQLFLPAGYPSPKAVDAIFSRSQVHIRRMLLEGSPVIVAMRPHERPSRRRICCISSARFRLTPLAPAEVLAGDLDPLPPRQRSLLDQVALHLREDDGQVQHRPPHALSWSMDSRRLMISTPFSRSQPRSSSTSVSDLPKRSSAATFTQSPGWRAALRRFSPGRFQEAPLPTSSKTARSRPTPGAGSPSCWRRRCWLLTHGRIRGVFRSSFAGPRFWHGGVMLRRAGLWLCWEASLFSRVGRGHRPELKPM